MFCSVRPALLPSVLAWPWPAAAVPSSFAWRDSCGHHVLPAPPGNPQGSLSSHRRVVTIRALPAAAAESGSETAGTSSRWTTCPALGFSRGPSGHLLEAWRHRLASVRHLFFACWLCGSLNACLSTCSAPVPITALARPWAVRLLIGTFVWTKD